MIYVFGLVALSIICVTIVRIVAIYKKTKMLEIRWKSRSTVIENIIFYSFRLNDFTDRFSNLKQLSEEEKSTLINLKMSINDIIKTIKDYEREAF